MFPVRRKASFSISDGIAFARSKDQTSLNLAVLFSTAESAELVAKQPIMMTVRICGIFMGSFG